MYLCRQENSWRMLWMIPFFFLFDKCFVLYYNVTWYVFITRDNIADDDILMEICCSLFSPLCILLVNDNIILTFFSFSNQSGRTLLWRPIPLYIRLGFIIMHKYVINKCHESYSYYPCKKLNKAKKVSQ